MLIWYLIGSYVLITMVMGFVMGWMKQWMIGTPWYKKILVCSLWPVVGLIWLWAYLFGHLVDGRGQELAFDSDKAASSSLPPNRGSSRSRVQQD